MKRHLLMIAALLVAGLQTAMAQSKVADKEDNAQKAYIYRVYLTDKEGTISLRKLTKFVSDKAVERRKRQGITLDETDLPQSPKYMKEISRLPGVQLIGGSRWLNTA
ncbi:MAG: serine protease, partial [Prevotella sp.]|nr:serine protease [Prevotella sp.]